MVIATGYFASGYIAEKIRLGIDDSLKDGARFDCAEIDVNVFTGKVRITSPLLAYDDSAGAQWSFSADAISVDADLFRFVKGNSRASFSSVEIDIPRGRIERERPDFNVFRKTGGAGEAGLFRYFETESFSVSAGYLDYFSDKPGGADMRFSAQGKGLLYDIKTGTFKREKYALRCTDLSYLTADSTYRLSAVSAILRSEAPEAELLNLRMTSVYDKEEFHARQSTRKSRHEISVQRISIFNPKADDEGRVTLHRVHLDRPAFEISRDNQLPLEDRTTLLPQEMLAQIDTRFHLDSLTLLKGSLSVEIYNKYFDEPAILNFAQINAEITDVQNDNLNAPAFTARAFGIFENETETSLYTRYDYGPNSPWELKLSGSTLDLENISPLLKGASRIEILSGKMTSLSVAMHGDKHRTEGDMDFRYRNLSVNLSEKEGRNPSKLRDFFTKKIGSLFYRDEITSEKGGEAITFEMERDVRKDFTGQWLDGILQGSLETVVKVDNGKVENVRSWFKRTFSGKDTNQ